MVYSYISVFRMAASFQGMVMPSAGSICNTADSWLTMKLPLRSKNSFVCIWLEKNNSLGFLGVRLASSRRPLSQDQYRHIYGLYDSRSGKVLIIYCHALHSFEIFHVTVFDGMWRAAKLKEPCKAFAEG